jgi:hypothetical protein
VCQENEKGVCVAFGVAYLCDFLFAKGGWLELSVAK